MEWLTPALEEYKTIRDESLGSMNSQQTTLKVGIGTVGVVIASGFNVWEKNLLPDLIFLIFNPIICYLTLLIWLGEVARMMRAGHFLAILEKRISAKFTEYVDVLSWENWIRTKDSIGRNRKRTFSYIAIMILFFFTALSSIMIGAYRICDKVDFRLWVSIMSIELLVFISILLFIWMEAKEIREL